MDVIKVFLEEDAKMPKRAHREDAGFDLFACERKRVNAGSNAVFDTGVHFDIPEGFYGSIKSKSGLCVNHDIITNGTIDAGYKGSVIVKLFNLSKTDYMVEKGDKIAQIVFQRHESPALIQVADLSELGISERGSNGFGSTGR